MNRFNFMQSIGFPIECDILDEMQKAYTLFNALGYISGNFSIISGCGLVGTTVADGVVFINGEVLEFIGGTVQTNVIIVEAIEALEFEDLSTHDVVYRRHATFGTATEQWLWADFKPSFPTKDISEALALKFDAADLSTITDRITELEKKNAVFQAGGGMVLWNKPAADIPNGWHEVVNWRDRMPFGWNPENEGENVGDVGGAASVAVSVPLSGYGVGDGTSGGTSGLLIVSTGAAEVGESFESVKKVSTAPTAATTNIMNPYRLVMFIEYIYTAPTL
ncbi:hypothetical protein SAMN05443549_109105 [Flavobacterium fluvii]|uniref:Uncharacterized protein n=1 Tax=Flavobacterium fluvii TaxID=468056 RepID=A0A1M5PA38_9FLAO|nr:hypothetical protein [Flavobacterium fluvii]SHG98113.1 hypothetical protein SAMN05443549_109105 [Flavobacterium fluvii]